ncbi:hypothetical protein [Pedobacter gandavensis]|uniref:Uncharacterized protein n=1 Tax=Pedobacter gandavensis TaxID=2679963 RepID=A0ABR6EU61_9SPHI|nr:hypothetical protein [Pedobacter gandavensis]MBB2148802.1 hypothetical protein [Pedobacter gandavensis]
MTDILEFAGFVKEMRDAQKSFEKSRSSVYRDKAEKLQKKVDEIILQIGIPYRTSQKSIF